MKANETSSLSGSKQYLTASQVRARFGNISDMTLWRWIRSAELEFPRPIVIASRRYFDETEITAWQLERKASRPAQSAA
jgi:predicted DNA-binding transcriptional regulator AlpA